MALKKCEKCGEMVAGAKAFCPVCDFAFVDEERRREKSKFESMDNTVQLGQTMFGNMLSDMGLNIAKTPKPSAPEKKVEVVAPAAEQPEKPAKEKRPKAEPQKEAKANAASKPAGRNRWYSIGGALIIAIWVLILIAAFVMFFYMPRSANF